MGSNANKYYNDNLYEKSKPVLGYLVKSGIPKQDAEDIVQDTLLKALTSLNSINEDKITSWMFTVAKNNYYYLFRKQKNFTEISLDKVQIEISNNTEDFLQKLIQDEMMEQINKVFNSLSKKEKELLILKYYAELSYKEISVLLDLDENTVKVYLYRARNNFRNKWIALGFDINFNSY